VATNFEFQLDFCSRLGLLCILKFPPSVNFEFLYISVEDGQKIELKDSPRQLIFQPKGVVYTLNVASNTYHALNDITYESEHKRWANFNHSTIFGK
jgi:hypothetical protein